MDGGCCVAATAVTNCVMKVRFSSLPALPDPEPGHRRILGIEDPDYQVGARLKALDKGILVAEPCLSCPRTTTI